MAELSTPGTFDEVSFILYNLGDHLPGRNVYKKPVTCKSLIASALRKHAMGPSVRSRGPSRSPTSIGDPLRFTPEPSGQPSGSSQNPITIDDSSRFTPGPSGSSQSPIPLDDSEDFYDWDEKSGFHRPPSPTSGANSWEDTTHGREIESGAESTNPYGSADESEPLNEKPKKKRQRKEKRKAKVPAADGLDFPFGVYVNREKSDFGVKGSVTSTKEGIDLNIYKPRSGGFALKQFSTTLAEPWNSDVKSADYRKVIEFQDTDSTEYLPNYRLIADAYLGKEQLAKLTTAIKNLKEKDSTSNLLKKGSYYFGKQYNPKNHEDCRTRLYLMEKDAQKFYEHFYHEFVQEGITYERLSLPSIQYLGDDLWKVHGKTCKATAQVLQSYALRRHHLLDDPKNVLEFMDRYIQSKLRVMYWKFLGNPPHDFVFTRTGGDWVYSCIFPENVTQIAFNWVMTSEDVVYQLKGGFYFNDVKKKQLINCDYGGFDADTPAEKSMKDPGEKLKFPEKLSMSWKRVREYVSDMSDEVYDDSLKDKQKNTNSLIALAKDVKKLKKKPKRAEERRAEGRREEGRREEERREEDESIYESIPTVFRSYVKDLDQKIVKRLTTNIDEELWDLMKEYDAQISTKSKDKEWIKKSIAEWTGADNGKKDGIPYIMNLTTKTSKKDYPKKIYLNYRNLLKASIELLKEPKSPLTRDAAIAIYPKDLQPVFETIKIMDKHDDVRLLNGDELKKIRLSDDYTLMEQFVNKFGGEGKAKDLLNCISMEILNIPCNMVTVRQNVADFVMEHSLEFDHEDGNDTISIVKGLLTASKQTKDDERGEDENQEDERGEDERGEDESGGGSDKLNAEEAFKKISKRKSLKGIRTVFTEYGYITGKSKIDGTSDQIGDFLELSTNGVEDVLSYIGAFFRYFCNLKGEKTINDLVKEQPRQVGCVAMVVYFACIRNLKEKAYGAAIDSIQSTWSKEKVVTGLSHTHYLFDGVKLIWLPTFKNTNSPGVIQAMRTLPYDSKKSFMCVRIPKRINKDPHNIDDVVVDQSATK